MKWLENVRDWWAETTERRQSEREVELEALLAEGKSILDDSIAYSEHLEATIRGMNNAFGQLQMNQEQHLKNIGNLLGAAITMNGGRLDISNDLLHTLEQQEFGLRTEEGPNHLSLLIERPQEPEFIDDTDTQEGE